MRTGWMDKAFAIILLAGISWFIVWLVVQGLASALDLAMIWL